jgi:L-ribulose-5-phosphate 4-epimerase
MLLEARLVTMTSGNVSARDPQTGLVVIKPSGVDYARLRPEDHPVVDPNGRVVEGTMKPSVDLRDHLYIYNHKPEIHSVIHTHSNYATSFAALGQSIPCCLTAIADQFGGTIPCTPYVSNEGDNIGQIVVEFMTRAPAVLLKNHGVFCFATTPEEALRSAIMVEDVAKTVHMAMLRGTPDVLTAQEIRPWWDRYHGVYGQSDGKH